MSQYTDELEAKLKSNRERIRQGREAKTLKDNSKVLFEVIDGEISLLLNKMTGDSPLSERDYLDTHGQLKGIRRIRQLLDSKEADAEVAAKEAAVIEEQLQSFEKETKSGTTQQ